LTVAGEELLAAISRPFDEIEQAVDRLNRYRDRPTGRIRINIPVESATLLIGPILREFVDRYPDVELDVAVSNHLIDVTEGGFDAGIRYGGTAPTDMVAQHLSADTRWVVAGSPANTGCSTRVRSGVGDRQVPSGIVFVNRNGLRWRDVPRAYDPQETLYDRCKR
jgi:DNA-binding transcriptional LysR family regulator